MNRVIHILCGLALAAFFVYYAYCTLTAPVFGQDMCGDCDGNHKVTIAELVTAVHNALEGDPCHEGCAVDCFPDEGNCPCTTCQELTTIGCPVSFCIDSDAQLAACLARFRSEHPGLCQ